LAFDVSVFLDCLYASPVISCQSYCVFGLCVRLSVHYVHDYVLKVCEHGILQKSACGNLTKFVTKAHLGTEMN